MKVPYDRLMNELEFRVQQIIAETHDTRTFVLEPTDGVPLRYLPGQFLTFLLQQQGHEIRRSYSLSTAPGVDARPAITVKRVVNGEISRFWLDTVREGTLLKALPPAGRFVLDTSTLTPEPFDLVLVGAGSGITPLFSMLKQVLTQVPQAQVTLLYANRRERDIIFRQQLDDWQRRYPERLRLVHVLSQPSDDWTGPRGRLNNSRLEQWVGTYLRYPPERARFFICGPFELMRTAEITLRFMGLAREQIRKENFVIDAVPVLPVKSEAHPVRLRFRQREYTLQVPAYTTILQAALREGIPLPYSCKGGRCSACAAICRQGRLHMSINDVLTDRDLAQGWVLTCTAYPDNDEVLIEIV